MENIAPQNGNDSNRQDVTRPNDGPGAVNDRPNTPDADQGSTQQNPVNQFQSINREGTTNKNNQEQEDWTEKEPSINDENVENGVPDRGDSEEIGENIYNEIDSEESRGDQYDRDEIGTSQYDRE